MVAGLRPVAAAAPISMRFCDRESPDGSVVRYARWYKGDEPQGDWEVAYPTKPYTIFVHSDPAWDLRHG